MGSNKALMRNSKDMNLDDIHAEMSRLKKRTVKKVRRETRKLRTRNTLRRWKRSAKTMLRR